MNQRDRVSSLVLKGSFSAQGVGPIDVRHMRSQTRFETIERPLLGHREEPLVVDERANLRPTQVVESKLTRPLNDASLPVSHLRMRRLLRCC
jgi:hypothetical protein